MDCGRPQRTPYGRNTAVATRDLSEYEIAYLFVDGIAERLRSGGKREPVVAAWGFTVGAVACCCT